MVTNTGKKVQEFYNKTPFPDYELSRFKTKEDLKQAAYPFAKILDRSIPEDANIIDIGTGTGQLSAFLSLRRKNVWGIDFSDSSLKKAQTLKEKLNLKSWHIKKIDILNEEEIKMIPEKFDYVLCMGVLHHTGNAYQAFKNIQHLIKPEGYIAIGLYNRYGRIPLKIRIFLAKTIFKNNNKIKDWFIKMQIGEVEDKERARGWWNDQYLHPHETTHTIGQILKWFKKNNIIYYQTIPTTKYTDEINLEIAGVWNNIEEKKPGKIRQIVKQLQWIITTHHEGGYWITFGKKSSFDTKFQQ